MGQLIQPSNKKKIGILFSTRIFFSIYFVNGLIFIRQYSHDPILYYRKIIIKSIHFAILFLSLSHSRSLSDGCILVSEWSASLTIKSKTSKKESEPEMPRAFVHFNSKRVPTIRKQWNRIFEESGWVRLSHNACDEYSTRKCNDSMRARWKIDKKTTRKKKVTPSDTHVLIITATLTLFATYIFNLNRSKFYSGH